jgi:nitrite reductase (NADH) small subunit
VKNYSIVAETVEIPSGERKRVEINGQRITIFNIKNTYYAINDTCPHKKTAPLIRGKLDGLGIKCPNHGYRFDLKTGECNIDPAFNTKIYVVKVVGNSILIAVG